MATSGLAQWPLWLSSRALLQRPRVRGFRFWRVPTHCSSSQAVAASHIEELEGLKTVIYNYVVGLWGEKEKEEERQQILA